MKKVDSSTLIVGPVRLSFMNVFEPKVNKAKSASRGEEVKEYSVTLLFPKQPYEKDGRVFNANPAEDVDAVREMIEAVAAEKFGPNEKGYKKPFRNGDNSYDDKEPAYPGFYYMNASAKIDYPPKLLDANLKDVKDGWQSGDWGKAKIRFYAYANVHKGVGCGLVGLQFFYVDDHFGGSSGAEGFEAEEVAGAAAEGDDPWADE